MTRHAWGVELPNGPANPADVVEVFGNGTFVLLHPELNQLPVIRHAAPDALILIRFYTANWHAASPTGWARQCAEIYRQNKHLTRHVTWANEQNLRAESGGLIGAPGMERGHYEVIRDWNLAWLDEWDRQDGTDDAILHSPALASGNSDDQDDGAGVGLEILRPVIEKCHILGVHLYWRVDRPLDDEWEGLSRVHKKHALYPNHPIVVKETGNFAVTDARSPAQYVAAGYYLQGLPFVEGFTYFIWADPTNSHRDNDMSRNPEIARAIGREDKRNWLPKRPESSFALPIPAPLPTPPPEPEEPPVSDDIVLSVPMRESIARAENWQAGPRGQTVGIRIYPTATGSSIPANEFTGALGTFGNPDSARSAHLLVGVSPFSEVARCVHDGDIAWPAGHGSADDHISVYVCQARPMDGLTAFQYAALAEIIRLWSAKYGIPIERGRVDGPIILEWDRLLRLAGGGSVPEPTPAPTPVPVPDTVVALRHQAWAIANELEKLGKPWEGQGIKAAVALGKMADQ